MGALKPKTYNLRPKSGQAALSLVFLTGGIIVLIGLSLAFLAISFINSSFGFQSANKALAVASAGVNDALIQLARNKSFSGSYCVPSPCGPGNSSTTVSQNTPSPGLVTIESQASSFTSRRRIKAIVSISSTTTQVNLISWDLVPIPQGGGGCPPDCPGI
ncbi:MAG: hypothetical protein HYT13_02765 [Candidatus Liptonbacteria bacterium]|nr:hypothetical protein [Candidatus Liptonbacteria bacterium]